MKELRIWIDSLLGRITMYRLVIYGLLVIAAFATMLMATDYLSYSPISFIGGIILAVGVSYGANRLFGWLFSLHPNAESAIITGLIISLIFSPPTTFLAVAKIALVAVFAMLSKYVLVIRSKHIFNPVAIATVLAAASGLAFASWWVGSPALLSVTAIVVLLILYKTQRLQMAAAFIVVAVTVIALSSMQTGTAFLQSIGLAFTSWPLVFFAGIMLSEPLTLPPRRWQQLAVAVLVALLLTLDFHVGKLSMTPALALVLGNALAFWFSIRRTVKLRLASVDRQGKDGHVFTFDTLPFPFLAGQYIELSLPHKHADSRGIRRIFSIIGQSGDDQLAVATRIPQQSSSFKSALLATKTGQTIYGTRVAGDFVLPNDSSVPIVCVAGGIGVTPYLSFLRAGGKRKITLLYSVRTIDDIMFVRELSHYNVDVVIVTPDTSKLPDDSWSHEQGQLSQGLLAKYLTPSAHVYISGPPTMVTTVRDYAKNAGAQHIHTDHFSGY